MLTHHRTTATVTDGLGMTAHPVGRCRMETARPIEVRLLADGALGAVQAAAESGGGPLMQRGADQHCGDGDQRIPDHSTDVRFWG